MGGIFAAKTLFEAWGARHLLVQEGPPHQGQDLIAGFFSNSLPAAN